MNDYEHQHDWVMGEAHVYCLEKGCDNKIMSHGEFQRYVRSLEFDLKRTEAQLERYKRFVYQLNQVQGVSNLTEVLRNKLKEFKE